MQQVQVTKSKIAYLDVERNNTIPPWAIYMLSAMMLMMIHMLSATMMMMTMRMRMTSANDGRRDRRGGWNAIDIGTDVICADKLLRKTNYSTWHTLFDYVAFFQ